MQIRTSNVEITHIYLPCVRNDDGAFRDKHSVVNVVGHRFMRYTWKIFMSMIRHERVRISEPSGAACIHLGEEMSEIA